MDITMNITTAFSLSDILRQDSLSLRVVCGERKLSYTYEL